MKVTVVVAMSDSCVDDFFVHVFHGVHDKSSEILAREFLRREDIWEDDPKEPENWAEAASQGASSAGFDLFRSTYDDGDDAALAYIKKSMNDFGFEVDSVQLFHYTMGEIL